MLIITVTTRLFRACLTTVLLAGLLSACGSLPVDVYRDQQPTLVMERFFDGPLKAWGTVQDWRGQVTRRFAVEMVGTWQDGVGTLDEQFVFADGQTQRRVWTFRKQGAGLYTGTAADVVGTAEGTAAGHALHFRYVLAVPVGERTVNVTMDDWMHLVDRDTLIGRTKMKKFGATVGEVTIVIQRKS